MKKRQFLQLAQNYDPNKIRPCGWFMSEKLDGQRCFWDGGISRNIPIKEVPWANTEKDDRFKDQDIRATGLWSRYLKPINAPLQFLDFLPPFPLDGELYLGKKFGGFQRLRSIVSRIIPDDSLWGNIDFKVFDSPGYEDIFFDSSIDLPQVNKVLSGCLDWINKKGKLIDKRPKEKEYEYIRAFLMCELEKYNSSFPNLKFLYQEQLPFNKIDMEKRIEEKLFEVCHCGGEGLMLRHPFSCYEPRRVDTLLKVKKLFDDVGTVIGYTFGNETDKGSKLLGKMGSLRVKYNEIEFDLSGFTDQERQLTSVEGNDAAYEYAADHPGERCNVDEISSFIFPIGSKVTFKYRELSNDGIPKEAKYFRKEEKYD